MGLEWKRIIRLRPASTDILICVVKIFLYSNLSVIRAFLIVVFKTPAQPWNSFAIPWLWVVLKFLFWIGSVFSLDWIGFGFQLDWMSWFLFWIGLVLVFSRIGWIGFCFGLDWFWFSVGLDELVFVLDWIWFGFQLDWISWFLIWFGFGLVFFGLDFLVFFKDLQHLLLIAQLK